MTDFRCGLFDLDGTLIDSMGIWAEIDRRFFASRGLPLPGNYFSSISGLSFYETAVYTKQRFSLSESTEAIMAEWNRMAEDEYRFNVPLKKGAKEYLEKLKADNCLLAAVTTLPKARFIPCLKRLGIYRMFDAFVSTDDISSTKSNGLAYCYAAGLLRQLPRDCMVFEDIPEGIRGAKKAGMKACLVYDSYSADRQAAVKDMADAYIEDWRNAYGYSRS